MKQAINILFLGGAKRVSMGRMIKAAGQRLGLEVNLFSYELTQEVPVAEIATVIEGRRWNDDSLFKHLHSVTTENAIDIILPFVDHAVDIAIRYCASDPAVWTPGSNAGMAKRMFNKSDADSFFRQLGIPLPALPAGCGPDSKIIAKPCFGSASKGIRVLTYDDYLNLSRSPDADKYLFQQYIEHRTEYTVDCYVSQQGTVICAVPRIRLEVSGGEVVSTQTIRDEEIESTSHRILRALKLTGPITLQFLREHKAGGECGPAMLMEVNPRLGGGAVCSVHAGADIPSFILEEFIGHRLSECHNWLPGTKICRYMQEVVFQHP